MKKIITAVLFSTLLMLMTNGSAEGQYQGATPVRQGSKVCGYNLISGFSFSSNREAKEILDKVLTTAGFLPERFVILAADVDNATACEDNNSSARYILYSPSWMKGLAAGANTNTYWISVGILAHEVGHHARNHYLKGMVSTPAIELEADTYAGSLMAKMGATLEQAQLAFRQPAMCDKDGSETHPKCADRLAAVEKGWRQNSKPQPLILTDDTEAQAKLYEQFRTNIKEHPNVAYHAGKEYLAKYEASSPADDKIVAYLKKWVASYEKIARRQQLLDQLSNKQVDTAFASASQFLTDYPDDLSVLFALARAGTIASTSGNNAHDADTINYTKRAIQLIQSGKSFDPNKPFSDKEKNEILGNLNYALGLLLKKNSPTEAATYFANAAQVEGPAKTNPLTYYSLADIYEQTQYVNLAKQFNDTCKTEDQAKTQACIDLKAKADLVVDHIIDALARAIAYSNIGPDKASFDKARAAWMESITNYYKYRNNGSTTGLDQLIAGITSKPLPRP